MQFSFIPKRESVCVAGNLLLSRDAVSVFYRQGYCLVFTNFISFTFRKGALCACIGDGGGGGNKNS